MAVRDREWPGVYHVVLLSGMWPLVDVPRVRCRGAGPLQFIGAGHGRGRRPRTDVCNL